MRKMLFIDRCKDCMYFAKHIDLCGHSESPDHNALNPEIIQSFCPLPDASQQDVQADACLCNSETYTECAYYDGDSKCILPKRTA